MAGSPRNQDIDGEKSLGFTSKYKGGGLGNG